MADWAYDVESRGPGRVEPHVRPCADIVGCQRDQDHLLGPARAAHAKFCAELNVAPTDPLPVVRYDAKERQRSLDIMR